MKLLRYIFLTFVCLTISLIAADPVKVTFYWSAPLTNVDDTPAVDLAGFNFYIGFDTNFMPGQNIVTSIFENINPAPQIQGTNDNGLIYGDEYSLDWSSNTSYWTAVTAVDFAGNESDFSELLWLDVTVPDPPTNLFLNLSW